MERTILSPSVIPSMISILLSDARRPVVTSTSSIRYSFMRNVGVKYKLVPHNHNSFIEGRTASIVVNDKEIGFVGEVHPQVLNNWGLEKPVVAFEMCVDFI